MLTFNAVSVLSLGLWELMCGVTAGVRVTSTVLWFSIELNFLKHRTGVVSHATVYTVFYCC